jgi:GntR family transcriptional regulator of arabinose operon
MAELKQVKYRKIASQLQASIASGRYKPGQRLPSEAALTAQFKASRPTVIRALRELQAGGLIDRRMGSGTFVRQATSPTQAASNALSFGLLVPGLADGEIFDPICVALARQSQALGHQLLWGELDSVPSDALEGATLRLCDQYIRQKVAGVFFTPLEFSESTDRVSRRIIRMLEDAKIPVVLLDRDLGEPPNWSKCDLVSIDNHRAGLLLAQHLLSMGNRTIHFLSRVGSASTIQARITGYQAALLRANLVPDPSHIRFGDPSDAVFVRAWLANAATRPDAIICGNDKTAAQLMQTLATLKIAVPQDVRVVGVDDLRYARLLRPALTTVHQPCQLIATVALHAMLERVAKPSLPARRILLAGDLVVRQSCGSAASFDEQAT